MSGVTDTVYCDRAFKRNIGIPGFPMESFPVRADSGADSERVLNWV